MNIFKEYVAYLKDNPEGYWFKRKLYGWGWTPARWQGWVTLVVFIAVILANTIRLDKASHSVSDTFANVFPQTLVLILLLIVVCYKTGEKPKWQAGIPKKTEDEKIKNQ